jgi:ABC-type phosphate transport system substrate-binding protein
MNSKAIINLLLLSVFGTGLALAQQTDMAVVVNGKNAAANVSAAELRKLFTGEKRSWAGGQPVKLFVRAAGTEERFAMLKLIGMSESEYKQYWTAQIFRGEAQEEPIALPSNGMQKEAVAAFPGGIALISAGDVKPGVKLLKVNGRLPGEPGYPLR